MTPLKPDEEKFRLMAGQYVVALAKGMMDMANFMGQSMTYRESIEAANKWAEQQAQKEVIK